MACDTIERLSTSYLKIQIQLTIMQYLEYWAAYCTSNCKGGRKDVFDWTEPSSPGGYQGRSGENVLALFSTLLWWSSHSSRELFRDRSKCEWNEKLEAVSSLRTVLSQVIRHLEIFLSAWNRSPPISSRFFLSRAPLTQKRYFWGRLEVFGYPESQSRSRGLH